MQTMFYKYISSIALLLFGIAFSGQQEKVDSVNQNNEGDTTSVSYERDFSFTVVGDLMCHSTQFNYARVSKDSFDFNGVYKPVKEFFDTTITFGNLETVFAGDKYEYIGYPVFNTPDDFLDAIKNSSFEVVFTANNHLLDRGFYGIKRTHEQLAKRCLYQVGTDTSEADGNQIRVFDFDGLRVAVLAYTYSNNGMGNSKTKPWMLSMIDTAQIRKDIEIAKAPLVDLTIVYLHFGNEYEREPNWYQKQIVKKTISYGADLILASHTHSIQPVDFYKAESGRIDSGFVAYSLGNFVSNQRWRYSDAGVILGYTIRKNFLTGKVKLVDVNYIPTWVFKGSTGKKREYIIYPSELALRDSTLPEFFTTEDKKLMKEAFNDTREVINKYSDRIKLRSVLK